MLPCADCDGGGNQLFRTFDGGFEDRGGYAKTAVENSPFETSRHALLTVFAKRKGAESYCSSRSFFYDREPSL